ncbi:Exosome complex component like [Actinidia chinensis var. chinensis]|uniref:Exosome complex component like n=1 Tax=Actinidia chinensis var. chinensis TaxID=1590841 RepID=A0A2R6R9M6_ACTCC|nr:Exosome complex component like [Actinidia chinensis var. chinensis]
MPRSQMDAKLPMDTFENVMQLAIEGCKAVANYIWEDSLPGVKIVKPAIGFVGRVFQTWALLLMYTAQLRNLLILNCYVKCAWIQGFAVISLESANMNAGLRTLRLGLGTGRLRGYVSLFWIRASDEQNPLCWHMGRFGIKSLLNLECSYCSSKFQTSSTSLIYIASFGHNDISIAHV